MSVNPFREPRSVLPSWVPRPVARWPATSVLVAALVLGAAAVAWRSQGRVAGNMARARTDALVVTSQLDLQFSQAISAVEALGVLARQAGGPIPGFERIASDLLASRPGVASLQWLPGGVVTQIVPKTGSEAAIGFNILQDPGHRIGVNQAARSKNITVAGPLRLFDGQLGLTVMMPIFRRSGERDAFQGFVAASVRLKEALQRARADELAAKGYNYLFLGPGKSRGKALLIAGSGRVSLNDALQQPVSVRNLELRLALRPANGWAGRSQAALDALLAAIVACLLGLLTRVWIRGRESATAASAATLQLAREIEIRTEAQKQSQVATERGAAASAELHQARAALGKAESSLAESKARAEAAEERERQSLQAAEAKLSEALGRSREAEVKLESKIHTAQAAAQAHQNELVKVEAALAEARQTVAQLQARLDTATRAAADEVRKSEAAIARVNADNRDLTKRLVAAETRIRELSDELERATNEPAHKGDPIPSTPKARAPESQATDRAGEPGTPERRDQLDLFRAATPISEVRPSETALGAVNDAESALPLEDSPTSAPKDGSAPEGEAEDLSSDLAGESGELALPPDPTEVPERTDSDQPRSVHHPRSAPPVNPAEFRKAMHQILPLLTDGDPGAKDCLKDNRATFRSAFASEAYEDFEQKVRAGDFSSALELLKKTARKRGVPI